MVRQDFNWKLNQQDTRVRENTDTWPQRLLKTVTKFSGFSIGSRAASIKRPLLIVGRRICVSVSLCVMCVDNFDAKYHGN